MNARMPFAIAQALAPFAPPQSEVHQIIKRPRFAVTYCSACGQEFGPGDGGYSQCSQHGDGPTAQELAEHRAWLGCLGERTL